MRVTSRRKKALQHFKERRRHKAKKSWINRQKKLRAA